MGSNVLPGDPWRATGGPAKTLRCFYGARPRVLGRYVRELCLLALPRVIASRPPKEADRRRWLGRSSLRRTARVRLGHRSFAAPRLDPVSGLPGFSASRQMTSGSAARRSRQRGGWPRDPSAVPSARTARAGGPGPRRRPH